MAPTWDLRLELRRGARDVTYSSCQCCPTTKMDIEQHTLELLLGNLGASSGSVEVVSNTASGSEAEDERKSGLWLSHYSD